MISARIGEHIAVRELRRLPNLYKCVAGNLFPLMFGIPDYKVVVRSPVYGHPEVWKFGDVYVLSTRAASFKEAPGKDLMKSSKAQDIRCLAMEALSYLPDPDYQKSKEPKFLQRFEEILTEIVHKEETK